MKRTSFLNLIFSSFLSVTVINTSALMSATATTNATANVNALDKQFQTLKERHNNLSYKLAQAKDEAARAESGLEDCNKNIDRLKEKIDNAIKALGIEETNLKARYETAKKNAREPSAVNLLLESLQQCRAKKEQLETLKKSGNRT